MKTPIPAPASSQHSSNYYLINPDLDPADALTHTLELMSGIKTTLDEYICANAGEPGVPMLVNTVHQVQMIQALTSFVLQRDQQAP
ncbi:hypothetical protein [Pseudomonas cremoricolorata]|uniref:hypothetical protein n=1 Tax=Pseudomonas cremoricolorata TaxID=157783 RepID=UPI00042358F9|nr:hypothetical protein [Pseudomonas cremoricolorata]